MTLSAFYRQRGLTVERPPSPFGLWRGKPPLSKFCSHCHGADGLTPGKVGEVYAGVTSYASAAIRDKKEGHLFHVITYGKARMPSHASQLSVEERWKIVRYIQLLQKQ